MKVSNTIIEDVYVVNEHGRNYRVEAVTMEGPNIWVDLLDLEWERAFSVSFAKYTADYSPKGGANDPR